MRNIIEFSIEYESVATFSNACIFLQIFTHAFNSRENLVMRFAMRKRCPFHILSMLYIIEFFIEYESVVCFLLFMKPENLVCDERTDERTDGRTFILG